MQPHNVIDISPDAKPRPRRPAAQIHQLFRENELLRGLSDAVHVQMQHKIDIVHCEPGEVIFEEDEPGNSMFLIGEGSVKISKRGRAGQQETLAYLLAGNFFGEMALVDSGKRSAQAAAVDSVTLGRIDREGWDLLLHLAPHEVLSNFTRSITQRLRDNNQKFIEEMMRNERLALLGSTIGAVMHDMNNPIMCIRGACEVMRATLHDELTSKMSGLIRDAVEKMEAMTKELLDFTRGKTQLNLQTVNVSEFLRQLEPDFARCRPFIDVRVEMLYDGTLHVDRHRLLRVFANLIRNAREAIGPKEGNILRLVVRKIDNQVRLELSDTGPGIPAEILPRVFEPFMTHGKTNGTGLGLPISKAVVEAHGGTISVSSSERGTTFTIDLPAPA
jgi:signal transduction histidine kinase